MACNLGKAGPGIVIGLKSPKKSWLSYFTLLYNMRVRTECKRNGVFATQHRVCSQAQMLHPLSDSAAFLTVITVVHPFSKELHVAFMVQSHFFHH